MELQCFSSSWFHPLIELRRSQQNGIGSFAKEEIKKGKVLFKWEFNNKSRNHPVSVHPNISTQVHNGVTDPDHYLNHSCDPNLWMNNDVTLVARRDIHTNEELTIDYIMFEKDNNWSASWLCQCGTTLCRKNITGRDWQLKDLQMRYFEHFSMFNNLRIAKAQSK